MQRLNGKCGSIVAILVFNVSETCSILSLYLLVEKVNVFSIIILKFLDEETGQRIDKRHKAFLRRRVNYENNVSVIVCYLTRGKNEHLSI